MPQLNFGLQALINANTTRVRIADLDYPAFPLGAISLSSTKNSKWEIYFDVNPNDLDQAGQPSLTTATTGGSIPRSTSVSVRITTVDSAGREGPPSLGVVSVSTGSTTDTNTVTASWAAVTGASSYNVYAGARPGMEQLIGASATTSMVITSLPAPVIGFTIPSSPAIVAIMLSGGGGISYSLSPFMNPPANRIVIIAQILAGAPGELNFTLLAG